MARRRRSAESRTTSKEAESRTTDDFSQMSDQQLEAAMEAVQSGILDGESPEAAFQNFAEPKIDEGVQYEDGDPEVSELDDEVDDDDLDEEAEDHDDEVDEYEDEEEEEEDDSKSKSRSKRDDDDEEDDLSIEDLEREELRLERSHYESQAGAQAARAGHLERQLRELKEQVERGGGRRAPVEGDEYEVDDPVLARRLRDLEDREQRLKSQQTAGEIRLAVKQASDDFVGEQMTEEVRADKHMSKRVGGLLQRTFDALGKSDVDVKHVLESDDPEYARTEAKRILNREFHRLYRQDLKSRIEEAKKRRGDSARGLKKKKRASAISQSSGKRGKARRKSKDPRTMPLKDLRTLIDRETG